MLVILLFTTGSQADGVTFKITHRGSILGAGGKGAEGPDLEISTPFENPVDYDEKQGLPGGVGGNALDFTVDCTIDTSQGVIYSGGGGAPSHKSFGSNTPIISVNGGAGGAGGQGYIGGIGGNGGTCEVETITSDTGEKWGGWIKIKTRYNSIC